MEKDDTNSQTPKESVGDYVTKYALGTAEVIGAGAAIGAGVGLYKGAGIKGWAQAGGVLGALSSIGFAKDFHNGTTQIAAKITGNQSHVEKLESERATTSEQKDDILR